MLPPQAWALYEAPLVGGLYASLGVGSGKTMLDILMALVMPGCRVAALLVPPGLVGQLRQEYLAVREHFRVPTLILPGVGDGYLVEGAPALHVVPYSKLQGEKATVLLDRLRPDLVLSDEMHNLKRRAAVRTGRFLRYFGEVRDDAALAGWTGTPVARSIKDCAHLMAIALGDGSPLPTDMHVVDEWAGAVDPRDFPSPAGALSALVAPGESTREAVARRIAWTRGVVTTTSNDSCGASLPFRERKAPRIPAAVKAHIANLHKTWERPDGEELVDALSVSRCARQLACGFYYRWVFTNSPTTAQVLEWFAARKDWHRELREKLKDPEPHMDSPLLLAKAAIRYHGGSGLEREWVGEDEDGEDVFEEVGAGARWASETWPRWRAIRDAVEHETEAVWVDDYLARDAAAWAREERGVVWYRAQAFGEAVAALAGLPLNGGGPKAEARILSEKGDRSVVASIAAHGTGRNGLQFLFSEQLVVEPPADGLLWEQLLGRLHRVGQEADIVVTHVYRHTPDMREALDRAVDLAKFIQGITTSHQKLLGADMEWL